MNGIYGIKSYLKSTFQPFNQVYKNSKSTMFTRRDLNEHFSSFSISSLYLQRERNHIVCALPNIFKSMLEKNADSVIINDYEIKASAKGKEILRLNTPVSFKDSFESFVERDPFLNRTLLKDSQDYQGSVHYKFNLG